MKIEDEFVSLDEPVSLQASLNEVLPAIEAGMKCTVKRDILARCQKFEISAAYEGMAEAVLIADELHYSGLLTNCERSLRDELPKYEEFVRKFIEVARQEMTNT